MSIFDDCLDKGGEIRGEKEDKDGAIHRDRLKKTELF